MLLDWDFYYNLVFGWFYEIFYPLSSALWARSVPHNFKLGPGGRRGSRGNSFSSLCSALTYFLIFLSSAMKRVSMFLSLASFFLVAEARSFFPGTVASSGTVWLCSGPRIRSWVGARHCESWQEGCRRPASQLQTSGKAEQNSKIHQLSPQWESSILTVILYSHLQALCLLNKQGCFFFYFPPKNSFCISRGGSANTCLLLRRCPFRDVST